MRWSKGNEIGLDIEQRLFATIEFGSQIWSPRWAMQPVSQGCEDAVAGGFQLSDLTVQDKRLVCPHELLLNGNLT